jgi:hypothetical protein
MPFAGKWVEFPNSMSYVKSDKQAQKARHCMFTHAQNVKGKPREGSSRRGRGKGQCDQSTSYACMKIA